MTTTSPWLQGPRFWEKAGAWWSNSPGLQEVGREFGSGHAFCCDGLFFPLPFHRCFCWFLGREKLCQCTGKEVWEHWDLFLAQSASIVRSFSPHPQQQCHRHAVRQLTFTHVTAKCLATNYVYSQEKNNRETREALYAFHRALSLTTASCSLSSSVKSFYWTIY